jgi:integrase
MTSLVPITQGAVPAPYSPATERAREYARSARAPSTLRAYRVDLADFTAWCSTQNLCPLPAEPQTVASYIAAQAETHKASTITRRLSAISVAHQVRGYDSPTKNELVRSVLKGIRRELGTASNGKSPLLAADIREMLSRIPDTLIGKRDKALLSVAFAGAFRRSELVGLDVADLEFTSDGLVITLRRSKTDQEGRGRKIGIPALPASRACAVRAVRDWLESSGITEGPIFRPVALGSRLGCGRLNDRVVALVIKRRLPADRDGSKYSGHSTRAGFVTSAAIGGASLKAIMNQTGHRSLQMVLRYTRDASLFRENALVSTGL